MRIVDPKETPTADLHQYLLGAVAPRPIAFASTIDKDGNANIAPYSFFNAFSSNPPILIFSSNRTVANNTTKDTLHNIEETGEVVINVVSYSIVRQMAVAGISFPPEVDEFKKSGLTPIPSDLVKPFRIQESPVQMECKVREIIKLGDEGGAGNLILCDVVRMHIDENVLDGNRINPHKIDLMGRMGRAYYTRASGMSVQTIIQPVTKITVGYDQLPESIRSSYVLTANNLGQLAGVPEFPEASAVEALKEEPTVRGILKMEEAKEKLHQYAKELLDDEDNREKAMQLLILADGL
ncbi:MAG: flavin reductase (DIM6/NTAB) family NADH-FMN oxidoreductase RutF [Polaribacter sp.]|jgi:flavin reductase (DIM6/NTAB) family NADH-FMN oxidoreductase RutF